jgi:hypothetical protein
MSSFESVISPSWPSKANLARYCSTSGSDGVGTARGGGGGARGTPFEALEMLLAAAVDAAGAVGLGAGFGFDCPGNAWVAGRRAEDGF